MSADKRYSCKKPCAECPFGKKTEPGTTGGAHPIVYAAQAIGPFWLPCHMTEGYFNDRTNHDLPQCAGAAMYRDLIGVAPRMPAFLHKLQGDPELVWDNPVDLMAHLGGVAPELVRLFLETVESVDEAYDRELTKVQSGEGFVIPTPRPPLSAVTYEEKRLAEAVTEETESEFYFLAPVPTEDDLPSIEDIVELEGGDKGRYAAYVEEPLEGKPAFFVMSEKTGWVWKRGDECGLRTEDG